MPLVMPGTMPFEHVDCRHSLNSTAIIERAEQTLDVREKAIFRVKVKHLLCYLDTHPECVTKIGKKTITLNLPKSFKDSLDLIGGDHVSQIDFKGRKLRK